MGSVQRPIYDAEESQLEGDDGEYPAESCQDTHPFERAVQREQMSQAIEQGQDRPTESPIAVGEYQRFLPSHFQFLIQNPDRQHRGTRSLRNRQTWTSRLRVQHEEKDPQRSMEG